MSTSDRTRKRQVLPPQKEMTEKQQQQSNFFLSRGEREREKVRRHRRDLEAQAKCFLSLIELDIDHFD